jgi:hypothetical protein
MFLSQHVLTAGPVTIHDRVPEPMFVFTDGAFENGHGSIGALIMDHTGAIISHFSWQCDAESDKLLTKWFRNPIFELELLPIAVAFSVWSQLMAHKPVCFYIDNEAAKSACVRAWGPTRLGNSLVKHICVCEVASKISPWYCRVPSFSNPADAPSRGECQWLAERGSRETRVDEVASRLIREGQGEAA